MGEVKSEFRSFLVGPIAIAKLAECLRMKFENVGGVRKSDVTACRAVPQRFGEESNCPKENC